MAQMAANAVTLKQDIANKLLKNSIIQRLAAEQLDGALKEANMAREVKLTALKAALALAEEQYADGLIDDIALQAAKNAVDSASIPITLGQCSVTTLLGAAFKGLGVAIWGATKAIISFLFTNPVGWMILLVGAVASGVAIFNHFHKTTEELREELSELKSELSDISTEIDSLNSELETTQSRIEELLALDTLSFTEEEELKNLQKQNDELQREIDLLALKQKQKTKETAKKFVETMNSSSDEYYDDGSKANAWSDMGLRWSGMDATHISESEAIDVKIKKYHEYVDELADIEQQIIDSGEAEDSATNKKLANRKAIIERNMSDIESFMQDKTDQWNKDADGLEYFTGDNLEDWQKEVNEWLDYIDTIEDKWAIASDGNNATSNAIKRIFNKEEYAEAKKQINDLVKQLEAGADQNNIDQQIQEVISSTEGLESELNELDISIDEATNSFTQLGEKAEEALTQETKITDSLSKISTLEDAYNALGDAMQEFTEDGTVTAKTLEGLNDTFKDVDGFEDLYKVLATGEGDVATAISKVANAYINQKGILEDLTEDEKQIMISRLQALGVINAEEILQTRQVAQEKLDAALQGYNIDLSMYASTEEAKLAIAAAAGLDFSKINDDNLQDLVTKYDIDVNAYKTAAEQKIQIAKQMALETAEANKAAALSSLYNEYIEQGYTGSEMYRSTSYMSSKRAIEAEYHAAVNLANSVDSTINNIKSVLDDYYNTPLKFDFSGGKTGIGRDYDDSADGSSSAEDKLDKLTKRYENKIARLEAQQTYLDNEIERMEAEDEQVSRDIYEEQIDIEEQKIACYQQERELLLDEMKNVAKNSDEWQEFAMKVWDVEHAIQDSTLAIVNMKKAIADLYINGFNEIGDAYDLQQDLYSKQGDYIQNAIDINELKGIFTSEGDLKLLQSYRQKELESVEKEIEALSNAITIGVNAEGEPLTKEQIIELASRLWDAQLQAQDVAKSIEEINQEIEQIKIDAIERTTKAFDAWGSLYDDRQSYIENYMKLMELQGKATPVKAYDYLIEQEEKAIDVNQQKLDALRNQIHWLDQGSDEWIDTEAEIRATEAAILDSKIAIEEFAEAQKQVYVDAFDKVRDAYGDLTKLYDDQKAYIQSYIDYLSVVGVDVPAEMYDKLIEVEQQKEQANIDTLNQLRESLAKMEEKGFDQYDEEWVKAQEDIRAVEAAIWDSKVAVEEFKKAQKELAVNEFNKVKDSYSDLTDIYDDQKSYIESYIDYLETLGIKVPAEMYEKLIATEKEKQQANIEALAGLNDKLANMEAKGYGPEDEEWVQAKSDIRDIEAAIWDSEVAQAEWNKTIREMETEKFEEYIKRIKDVVDELDNIYDLLSKEDVATEDGAWTEEGITSLGVLAQKMEIAKKQIADYQAEIEELNEKYKSGAISEQEYNDRLTDLKNAQWDAIDSYESAKDAIVDLNEARIDQIENGVNKEIEAMEDLIRLKKDELSVERDLWEFKNRIKEKTTNIGNLQRQIIAMSGSTDAATVAQRIKLEAELKRAQEELDNEYVSHSFDSQSSALDDEQESYVTSKEDYIKLLRESLEDVESVVANTMSQVLINADSVLGGLNNIAGEYGITLNESLITPWNNAVAQAEAFKNSALAQEYELLIQNGIFTGEITQQLADMFGSGSLMMTSFQTGVFMSMDAIQWHVENATSQMTSDLVIPFDTAVKRAKETFSPSTILAMREVAAEATRLSPTLKNDLAIPFEDAVAYATTTFAPELTKKLQEVAGVAHSLVVDETTDIVSPIAAGTDAMNTFGTTAETTLSNIAKSAAAWNPDLTSVLVDATTKWGLFDEYVDSLINGIVTDTETKFDKIEEDAKELIKTLDDLTTKVNNTGNDDPPLTYQNKTLTTTTKQTYTPDVNTPTVSTLASMGQIGQVHYVGDAKKFQDNLVQVDGSTYYKRIVYDRDGESTEYYYKATEAKYGKIPGATSMSGYFFDQTATVYKKRETINTAGGRTLNTNVAARAKGTLGTTKDEWAITDEPWLGDELTMYATPQGTLSYMRAGSTVVPADITKNLIEWGKLTPNMDSMANAVQGVNLMTNVVNKPEISLEIENLLRCDNVSQDSLPEVKKFVAEELDKFARNLNYNLKRVGSR